MPTTNIYIYIYIYRLHTGNDIVNENDEAESELKRKQLKKTLNLAYRNI